MSVKDVSDAFPLLPLHPSLWPFMLFCWYFVGTDNDGLVARMWCLYIHLFAGFGMAGMPGVWKIFFTDVVMGMARSEGVVDIPVHVFVDDCSLIGAIREAVDTQGEALAVFLLSLGIVMKAIKTLPAALRQFYIGLWWDSVHRTLELDPTRRAVYLEFFDWLVSQRSWALRDAQSCAGRAQRCMLTFPRGSNCMLSPLYEFMRGLSLPWQKRRVTQGAREAVSWTATMLRENSGRGYFSYDRFSWGPIGFTDASKERRYCGGGWVNGEDGEYLYYEYGASSRRKPIDELEGDTVVCFVEENGHKWCGKIVVIYIDNRAFQLSGVKGWSKAERLNSLLKRLYYLSLKFDCVLVFEWISTHDNTLADLLSRPNGEVPFLAHPLLAELLCTHGRVPRRNIHCGATRQLGKSFSSRMDGDGPGRSASIPFQLTVSYSRCSVFAGMPSDELLRRLDQVLDNRLGTSSHRSIRAALGHWDLVRARHGWSRILVTDDPERGGKLATLLLYFVDETELVYSSIANYIWALRSWMKFQRQADPAYGILEWSDVMQGVEVLTFMPSESRKEVPGSWIAGAVRGADPASMADCRAVLIMLLLVYTFARSESPVPKNRTGPDSFNDEKQLCVKDVRVRTVAGRRTAQWRLKGIKQDTLGQRAAAQGDGDWVIVGELDGELAEFSILLWLQRYFSFFVEARDPGAPFFVCDDLVSVYTYGQATEDCRRLWALTPGVTLAQAAACGLHGLRVAGNCGTTRSLGKWLAKVQGGWESDAQDRYDRVDLRDVVRIPDGIVRSWQQRDPDFEFGAILPTPANGAGTGPGVRASPRPAGGDSSTSRAPPVERRVDSSGGGRRARANRVRVAVPVRVQRAVSGPPPGAVEEPRLPAGWLRAAVGRRKAKVYYSPSGERFQSFKSALACAAGTTPHPRQPASQDVPPRVGTCSRTSRRAAAIGSSTTRATPAAGELVEVPLGVCGRVMDGGFCRRPQFHDLDCSLHSGL